VLPARLTAQGFTLAEADESKLDTERIQKALDSCLPGQAVELKPDAGHGAFLTGPLTLRSGVTLLVDAHVILFASRNPRDYDLEPGVCGTVSPHGHACKALLTGDHIHAAAIMGDGIIDGRGGEKLLGQNVTWWDVADKALQGGLQNNFRMVTLTASDNITLYRIQLKDFCIRSSPNPISVSTHYDSYGPGHEVYGSGNNHIPVFEDIRFENVSVDGGKVTLDGLDNACRLGISLRNVILVHPETDKLVLDHALIHLDGTNISAAGDDLTLTGTAMGGTPPTCSGKFVPFPAEVTVRAIAH
jgi:hypothetical protein